MLRERGRYPLYSSVRHSKHGNLAAQSREVVIALLPNPPMALETATGMGEGGARRLKGLGEGSRAALYTGDTGGRSSFLSQRLLPRLPGVLSVHSSDATE